MKAAGGSCLDQMRPPSEATIASFLSHVLWGAHLGMTFHGFLVGRDKRKIAINGYPVEPLDPILQHPATHAPGSSETGFPASDTTTGSPAMTSSSSLRDPRSTSSQDLRLCSRRTDRVRSTERISSLPVVHAVHQRRRPTCHPLIENLSRQSAGGKRPRRP